MQKYLRTNMKQFNYPVDLLIRGVKERPALWDKTLEIYKDREERKQSWDQIIRTLEVKFDTLSRQEQRAISDVIMNKWTNIRDTFIKSLKNQATKSNVKKYFYHDEMDFLLKVVPQEIIPDYEETRSDPDEDPIANMVLKQEMTQDASEEESSSMSQARTETKRFRKDARQRKLHPSPERDPRRRKRSKKSEPYSEPDESPTVDFVEMEDSQDPRIMNEDEAFFASLLPTVVKYSEEERLEFRIDVLAVMKSISQKRRQRWNNADD